MNSVDFSFRNANAAELASALQDARKRTLAIFDCFQMVGLDASARVPQLTSLNPMLWELGHIAWFAEWFILREAASSDPVAAQGGSLLTKGDDWFDSNTVMHRSRWTLDLPSTGALKTYCREVLDRVLDKLTRTPNLETALYPYRLCLAHEDMHGEALIFGLQTLDLPAPAGMLREIPPWAQGEINFVGGSVQLGSSANAGFIFDNEKFAHTVAVAPFSIDSTLVSNAQFMDFISDGGYAYPQFWSGAGHAWLMRQEQSAPRGWRRHAGNWRAQRFGDVVELVGAQPVRHVSLYEAHAYCAWAQRRLPTEIEWEFAALAAHPAFRWGDLWEWTASRFLPYPEFSADAYREYSAPWFDTHQVLRGASIATVGRLRSPKYRNFFKPERNDVLNGFRTCAL